MTLTELKYIVAVAREKHFGRAAEACFVSQPTLSVAIKKLEEELDVKLFERSANEVTVTPLGEEIVRQAQSVLEQAANIKDIAKRYAQGRIVSCLEGGYSLSALGRSVEAHLRVLADV